MEVSDFLQTKIKKTWMKVLEVSFADSLSQTCQLLFDVDLTAVMPVSQVGICAYCLQLLD